MCWRASRSSGVRNATTKIVNLDSVNLDLGFVNLGFVNLGMIVNLAWVSVWFVEARLWCGGLLLYEYWKCGCWDG